MAQIVTRIFNYVPKQALLLAGDEWLRPVRGLGDWTRIRLGVLVAVRTPVGYTGNIYDGTFLLSLVSGRLNTASGYACDNAVGVSLCGQAGGSSVRTWTYAANAGNPYYNTTGMSNSFYRRYTSPYPATGQVYANSTALATSSYQIPVSGVGIRKRRLPLVLDISKAPSTGIYTFTLYWPITSSASIEDFRPDHLLDAVDQLTTPIVAGLTWTSSGAQTLSFSDLTGPFDTLSVYWGRQTFPLELYAACVSLVQDSGLPQASYPARTSSWDYFAGASQGTVTSPLNTGSVWPAAYTLSGTSGSIAQTGLAGTSSAMDESFTQYTAGTVTFQGGTLGAGTLWTDHWLLTGTYDNPIPAQPTQLYGTTVGFPDESFSQYATGTVFTNVLSAGSGFTAPWVLAGTFPASGTVATLSTSAPVVLYGTQLGPHDSFDQYAAGSIAVMSAGTGWAAPFYARYFAGTSYPNAALAFDMGGTSSGFPWDSFEGTATGTYDVISTGTGWSTYGTFYAY